MESLLYLALKKIVQQLTPQDLASCADVCREWREVFNQDWMWRPHCTPELEEPLQSIPSILTPAFVAPDDSTLPPLCPWRLAFKEKHLWKNWKKPNLIRKKIHRIKDKDLFGIDFLTDTLVVVWYADHVEILDASVTPPVSWPQSDTTISIGKEDKRIVSGTLLIILKDFSVEVYNADLTNKSIKLKHCIFIQAANDAPVKKRVVKEHNCMFTNEKGSNKMNIYDLNTGQILKEEAFPLEISQSESFRIRKIHSSSTSDFIAVTFTCKENASLFVKLSVYDMKKLNFLPDVMFDLSLPDAVALHHQWLAYNDRNTMVVYDLETKKVLRTGGGDLIELFVSENSFLGVFRVYLSVLSHAQSAELLLLKRCYPPHETIYTLVDGLGGAVSQIGTSEFSTVLSVARFMLYLLRGNKVINKPLCQLTSFSRDKLQINQSCTIMLEGGDGQLEIRCWW